MAANSFEAKKIKSGSLNFDWVATEAVSAGECFLVGSMFGISPVDASSGDTVGLDADGVFDIAKEATTDTYSIGDRVSWDASANTVVAAPGTTGDVVIGVVTKAAVATDTHVRVLVSPSLDAATS
jgi:predicted RecA/RadA family phage recombinase